MAVLRHVGSGLVIGLVALAGWSALPASAAQPSGTVIAVIQRSEADGQTGRRVLVAEAAVFSGDKIITGPVGQAQIRFRDDTRLVVGPNSQMTIDAFVFEGDTARSISVNAVRGVFRFITGNSPKDAYKIATPTAIIGVRGTEFDINVEPGSGVTRVANFTGITRICPRDLAGNNIAEPPRPCIETQGACGVSVVRPNRDVWRQRDRRDRNRDLTWFFQYVRDQSGLLPDFQVSLAQCGSTAYEPPPPDLTPFSPPPPPLDGFDEG